MSRTSLLNPTGRVPRRRQIWDAIVFGFELPMLQLHMRTLFSSVAGFLVTESDSCFQTRTPKQPVLTEALRNGTLRERALAFQLVA